eukprot:scaffold2752_cov393-Prasinococcus_capsulatus_cf.AAC.4
MGSASSFTLISGGSSLAWSLSIDVDIAGARPRARVSQGTANLADLDHRIVCEVHHKICQAG